MSLKRLNVEKNTGYLFFRNPPLPQISTFSLGQKGVLIMRKVLIWGVLIMRLHSTVKFYFLWTFIQRTRFFEI